MKQVLGKGNNATEGGETKERTMNGQIIETSKQQVMSVTDIQSSSSSFNISPATKFFSPRQLVCLEKYMTTGNK